MAHSGIAGGGGADDDLSVAGNLEEAEQGVIVALGDGLETVGVIGDGSSGEVSKKGDLLLDGVALCVVAGTSWARGMLGGLLEVAGDAHLGRRFGLGAS